VTNPRFESPVMVVVHGPFATLRPEDVQVVPVGASIASLAPETNGKPLVCTIDGGASYLLRKDWECSVESGDIVTFLIDPPEGKEALRGVLLIVVAVASFYTGGAAAAAYGPAAGAAAGAAVSIVGSLVVNALVPINPAETFEQKAASPTYSASLSGNVARLDQPIPKICGRMKVTPPFAAQPYMEYDDNNDQFYYAIFAVGVGSHSIEQALIDDTAISHFQDVLTARYLPPGTLPTDVLTNVATAPEVAGQDCKHNQYIGGFAACGPKRKCIAIGIDIMAPRGLGVASDDGSMGMSTLQWRVEYREIDDFGTALTAWALLAAESRNGSTTTPQRWSYKYELPEAVRIEVRLARTNAFNDNARWFNDMVWASMRAYLDEDAPLHPDVAHYEVVLRASEQLSALSQRNISLIVLAKTRTWSPDDGWSEEDVHTRNPAWWLAELWSSGTWGEGLPDSRIDLQTIYDLSLVWEDRQDRFDYVFDTATDCWEAAQLIAGAGRARVFRRYGIATLARDQLETLPVTAFTPRNCVPDSMVLNEALPVEDTPDGVILEYYDNRKWDWIPIDCPCPGVETMENPVYIRRSGITGKTHAEREGLYEAASMFYRTRKVSCTTEMQGMLPAYMSPIRWMPETIDYGQSGDVAYWDEPTLTLGLTEPVIWGEDQIYITLIKDDGTLTAPQAVIPGPTPNDVVLAGLPDFGGFGQDMLDDAMRERPKYLLGPLETSDELVKISAITDGGKQDEAQLFNIEAVIDDSRVHAADNHLLPGPGDIQDPVDTGDDVDPNNFFVNISNSDGLLEAEGFAHITSHTFGDDGVMRIETTHTVAVASQWLIGSPVENIYAARYEIFVHVEAGVLSAGSAAVDTWLSLGTSRKYEGGGTILENMRISVQIREVSTGIVQDTASIILYGLTEPPPPEP
jgi:hypothetical protein